MTSIEVLQQCTVSGNNVKLPAIQLERKLYQDTAKALELIGGKWKGGKVSAFEFKIDPTDLLSKIAGGTKVNLKKEFQFFPTPQALAETMVYIAELQNHHRILEPSAGHGAILKEISKSVDVAVDYCELMDVNRTVLDSISVNATLVGHDFMEIDESYKYDRIIANPPFKGNQDIEHIQKMYRLLNRGGMIVTLCSPHSKQSSNRKETEFREWLSDINAEVSDVPSGTFKESGTNIATILITIQKPL